MGLNIHCGCNPFCDFLYFVTIIVLVVIAGVFAIIIIVANVVAIVVVGAVVLAVAVVTFV